MRGVGDLLPAGGTIGPETIKRPRALPFHNDNKHKRHREREAPPDAGRPGQGYRRDRRHRERHERTCQRSAGQNRLHLRCRHPPPRKQLRWLEQRRVSRRNGRVGIQRASNECPGGLSAAGVKSGRKARTGILHTVPGKVRNDPGMSWDGRACRNKRLTTSGNVAPWLAMLLYHMWEGGFGGCAGGCRSGFGKTYCLTVLRCRRRTPSSEHRHDSSPALLRCRSRWGRRWRSGRSRCRSRWSSCGGRLGCKGCHRSHAMPMHCTTGLRAVRAIWRHPLLLR